MGNYRIPILIAILFILLNLIGLSRTPIVLTDEATLNDPAKELAFHGKLRSSIFAGHSGFEDAYFWQPPGQVVVTAAVYKTFGFGIWQSRVPVLFFAAGVCILLYFLAMRLFNSHRAAAFASLLFAFDPRFIRASRSARMDAQCMFFSLLGVFLYLIADSDRKRRYMWIALSGLAIGIAGITHPIAIIWAITIIVLIIAIGPGSKIKSLVSFIIPAGLPAAIWLVYALRTPQLFLDQFVHHSNWHVLQGSIIQRLIEEPSRYMEAYRQSPILLLAYIVAFIWAMWTPLISRKIKITIAILVVVPVLFNALFMIKILVGYYYLHPILILAACTGAMIAALIPGRLTFPRNAKQLGITAFVILLVANILLAGIIGRYLVLAYQWEARDYRMVQEAVTDTIPPGSIVWGPTHVWYATEKVGAQLLILGEPDPKLHDFAVTLKLAPREMPPGFIKIRDIGIPVPLILGRFEVEHMAYQMEIWKSELRASP